MSKRDDKDYEDDDDDDLGEAKYAESKLSSDCKINDIPKVEIISLDIDPIKSLITDGFDLKINFSLDRDVVAAFWQIKVIKLYFVYNFLICIFYQFMVDSTNKRLFRSNLLMF